jgi:hypothetical protein
VVKDMNGDKALGHDGFSIDFFQVCWDVIKVDIMGVFHDFHASSVFVKNLSATFVAPIPLGGFYKVKFIWDDVVEKI